MKYLIIEMFPSAESASIVVNETTGANVVFESWEEAEKVRKECQDGKILEA